MTPAPVSPHRIRRRQVHTLLAGSSEMQRSLEPYLGKELAPLSVDGPTYTGPGVFEEIPHPSEILRDRSEWAHRLGQLYDDMIKKDTTLAGLIGKRKRAVTRLPRSIDPADSSPLAIEAAELCRAGIGQIPLFHEVLRKMLDAPLHGVRVMEVIWKRAGKGAWTGAWLPVNLKDRPMHRFAFERGTERLHVRQPGGSDPVPAPNWKFLVLRSGTRDNPWGDPELDSLYWLWWIAKHSWKYWAVYMERWAQPLSRVKYRHTKDEVRNAEQVDQALDLVRAIQTDQGIAVPDGLDIDLLESARNGSVSYGGFVAAVHVAYALFILGEVDTSGLGDSPGSYAKSEVSNDVRLETVTQDAHLVESHLTETLLRWIVDVNLGSGAPMPAFRIHARDAADRQRRVEGIGKALEWGVAVPTSYVRMTLQTPAPVEGEEVLEPPAAQQPTGSLFPFSSAEGRGAIHLAEGGGDPETDPIAQRGERQAQEIDAAGPSLVGPTLDYYDAHQRAVLSAWDSGAGVETVSTAVRQLGSLPRARAASVAAAAIHGMGLSLLHLRELDAALRLAAPPPTDYARADTPEAAIEYWARLLSVPKEAFSALDDQARRLAFTVAGVQDAALLINVNQLVEESIATAITREDFVARLGDLYESHGVTPTSRWHAELVYKNMVRQSHAAVQQQQVVKNPAAPRLTPYLRWRNLDPGRARDRKDHNHRVMHGYVAAVEHPIWKVWGIPAGHGCTCRRELISAPEARRLGYTGSEPAGPWPTDPITGGPAQPDPGFRASASLGGALSASLDRAGSALDGASGDVARALETLFGVLQIFDLLGGS